MVLPHFEHNLEKYANLLIKKGINVQKGHTLLITIAAEHYRFARLLTKKAYEAGAAEVIVDYTDDQITREKLLKADEDRLLNVPDYVVEKSHYLLGKKASRLVVRSSDPNVFAGVDSDRLSGSTRATSIALEKQRAATQANKVSWNLVAAASPEWAARVFPDLASEEEQVDALWDAIFKMNRIYEEDPIKAWDDHQARLVSKANLLNDYQFDALHYMAPGTDLTLGMPENHVWEAAGSVNAQGEETVKRLVEENDGARALGEVALVPHKTPISLSGLTFFNTLFDENASNHLAIGAAYAFSIKGGTEMTNEELKAAGLNRSTAYVDFMIGSEHMDIDGITKDGQIVPIFRGGEWAI